MQPQNRIDILHIIKNIAQRGVVDGDFKVREEDLNKLVAIVEKDNGRTDTPTGSIL